MRTPTVYLFFGSDAIDGRSPSVVRFLIHQNVEHSTYRQCCIRAFFDERGDAIERFREFSKSCPHVQYIVADRDHVDEVIYIVRNGKLDETTVEQPGSIDSEVLADTGGRDPERESTFSAQSHIFVG